MNEIILPVLFLIVSFVYSSVGLGGGSSYTALLIIFGINYKLIPMTSLTLNIFVTLIGLTNFWRKGYGRLRLTIPFLLTSIPMTYLGSKIDIPEDIFYSILFFSLMLIITKLYFLRSWKPSFVLIGINKWIFILLVGSFLGFIAGAVGIGGGIYLVPIIFIFGLGTEKEAAATGVVFIFVNSLVGLFTRVQSNKFESDLILPLLISVIIGGYLGSFYGSVSFKPVTIQRIMGIVLIFGALFLLKELL